MAFASASASTPALKEMNYSRLFALFEGSGPIYEPIRSFLETVLVIHGVRPAAHIFVNLASRTQLAELLEKQKVAFRPYSEKTAWVINRTATAPASASAHTPLRDYPTESDAIKNHVKIGELLGYMTPVNIRSSHRCNKQADLLVTVASDGNVYNVQLCPQIICDRTDEEIRAYYAPMINILTGLRHVFSGIDVRGIELRIRPFARGGGFTRVRRHPRRKTRKWPKSSKSSKSQKKRQA